MATRRTPGARRRPQVAAARKVKVAVTDIDGILRGKYLHTRQVPLRRVEGGFGFCDVVFGWDIAATSATTTPSSPAGSTAFPTRWRASTSATASQRAVGRQRAVLPRRLRRPPTASPIAGLPAPDAEARAEARREAGLRARCAAWSSSGSTSPRRRRPGPRRRASGADADHAGHVRLLAAAREPQPRVLQRADGRDGAPSACRSRACTPRPAPASTRRRSSSREALEAADRAILFKTGAKEIGARFGIMPSFMAKWSAQLPGCSRPHPPEPRMPTARTTSSTTPRRRAQHERSCSRATSPARCACLMEFAPMFWPTVNSYKRLVDGFWAPVKPTWGVDNRTASFRVIAGTPEVDAARDALPGRRHEPLPRDGRRARGGPRRRREGPQAHRAADHRHQPGRREHPARAAHADRDHAHLRASRRSRATGSATSSSTTSPPRANGNGGSGWTPSPTGS